MTNLISSNALNYQEFLIQTFQRFLLDEKTSEKTRVNYMGDVRQFLNWLSNSIQTKQNSPSTHLELLKLITPELLENYKRSMLLEHMPVATINRRLSSLRMFFRCVISQDWLPNSPMEFIANIPKDVPLSTNSATNYIAQYLESEFSADSETQSAERTNLTEFLDWLKNTHTT